MTQPDKWDEIAEKLFEDCGGYILDTTVDKAMLTTALRQAYYEGERAGLEYAGQQLDELIAAIRAAKETKA